MVYFYFTRYTRYVRTYPKTCFKKISRSLLNLKIMNKHTLNNLINLSKPSLVLKAKEEREKHRAKIKSQIKK